MPPENTHMKKVTYNGEEYYYSNGKWLDCHFIEVPQELSRNLGRLYPYKELKISTNGIVGISMSTSSKMAS